MKVGIDISQTAYQQTGVANFLVQLIQQLLKHPDIRIVLFYSSFGKYNQAFDFFNSQTISIKRFPFPPWLLDTVWNRLHILPIETFIGSVDIFLSSDWTQPPTRSAKSATILYDLVAYKYPKETHDTIVATQKRKLDWSKKECDLILCISEATKRDALEILGVRVEKLTVIYPGI